MAHGHHAAAQELWSRYGRAMSAYAAAVLRVPRADAAHPVALDAVQSVFVRVLEMDRRTLAQVENVQAWLTASVRHAVLNLARAGARQDALRLRLSHAGREPEPCDPPALDALHRAIDRLPDDARELLLLKHVAGLTLEQMALSLNENRNTIASRLRSAMARLREALEDSSPQANAANVAVPSFSRPKEVRP